MPYLVTTWPACPGCVDPSTAPHVAKPPFSRWAFATIEGDEGVKDYLQPVVRAVADQRERSRLVRAVAAIPESGTSEPIVLPDGSLVEIAATSWRGLATDCGAGFARLALVEPDANEEAEVLAAWNSRHGVAGAR